MHDLDEATYHARLRATAGVSLVLFTSPTCGTCRVVAARLPQAAPPGAQLFAVDVQQATGLARAFEVFHLPTLFLYRDGHFHTRLECEITAAALHAAIAQALAEPPQEEP